MSTADSNRRIRVACFAHLSEISGAVTSLLEMARHLDSRRFDAVLIIPGDGSIQQRAVEAGVRTVILSNPEVSIAQQQGLGARATIGVQRLKYVRAVAAYLRAEKVDVAYISSVASIFAGVGAVLARKPIAWHVHETIESRGPAMRMKLAFIERVSAAILFASESARKSFPATRVKRQKLQLNWIDLGRLTSANPEADEAALHSLGLHRDQPIVLANGVFPRKGADLFLQAASTVLQTLRNSSTASGALPVFILAGSVTPEHQLYYQQLESMAKTAGIENNVLFVGVRNDLPELLRQSAVFVSSSRNEALPITILEAMAAQTPIVVTDVGDCSSLLEAGRLGTVVPPEAPKALASAILDVLTNTEEARTKAQLARDKVLSVYQPDGLYRDLESILIELAQKRAPRPDAG